jgi:hypothetical protein
LSAVLTPTEIVLPIGLAAAQGALVEAVYFLRNSAKPIAVRHVSFLGHKLRCSVD